VKEEYNFLLTCLRAALNPQTRGHVSRRYRSELNWPRLLALAQRHQVLPLLLPGLNNCGLDVPECIHDWVARSCRQILARNLLLASELLALCESFRLSDIPAVPFKGPAMAVALYGDLSLRQIGDLDIFIDRKDVPRALKLLERLGYAVEPRFKLMTDQHLYFWHKDIELIHPGSGVRLELHWAACEPEFDRRLSAMTLWTAVSTTALLNGEVPAPAQTDLLLLLSLHGLRHRWECLKWICDVAAMIIASPGFDWNVAIDKADKLSRRRMVLLAAAVARDLFEVTLPPEVLDLIAREPALPQLVKRLRARQDGLSAASFQALSGEAVLAGTYFDFLRLQTRDDLSERVGLFARLLTERFTPNAHDKQYCPLPGFLEPLYWLIRPFRLCMTYGPACILQLTQRLFAALCGAE
jgi:Uncharacterised nucleotidyltransferase